MTMSPRYPIAIRCLAVSVVAWLPLLLLTMVDGSAWGDATMRPLTSDLSVLVRFLVALPLLVYSGNRIRLRLHAVVEYLEASEMLTGKDREDFREAAARHERWSGARAAWVCCALLAIAGSWATVGFAMDSGTVSWASDGSGHLSGVSIAGWWFFSVSFTLWHTLALMRLWQFASWSIFLARLSRLELQLVPTHPDRCGGIGILEVGQLSFVIPVAAFASILAASTAESMLEGSLLLPAAVPYILVFALASFVVLTMPVLGFASLLVRTKREGLVAYGDLGEELFRAFGQKWAGISTEKQRALLGNVDPSSLADYGYCYEVVTAMRVLPLSRDGIASIAAAAVLPFAPLVLINHSAVEILRRLLGIGG